jgi:hypothetical protein
MMAGSIHLRLRRTVLTVHSTNLFFDEDDLPALDFLEDAWFLDELGILTPIARWWWV